MSTNNDNSNDKSAGPTSPTGERKPAQGARHPHLVLAQPSHSADPDELRRVRQLEQERLCLVELAILSGFMVTG